MVRDTGTANAVQGFVSDETVVSKNIIALPTTFIFQLLEYIQIPLISISGTTVWVKAIGTWRQAVVWVKVSGTWKQASLYVKVTGTWRP